MDGLVDMTGGVGETIELEKFKSQSQREDLFRIIHHSKENHSLVSAAINVNTQLSSNTVTNFKDYLN